LKQIDLYKKDNKKLKELYEKILFDYQNITKQKEEMENSKNLYEDRIKALINKNNSLKIKLEDLRIKNIAYYEEIDKYKNLNQSNIDKLLLRKEKEISQYRGQITQLKMEIGTLQKRADERTKNSINSATVTGFKKIKPIYQNKKDIFDE
jgi:chromosome segregation ATPase